MFYDTSKNILLFLNPLAHILFSKVIKDKNDSNILIKIKCQRACQIS